MPKSKILSFSTCGFGRTQEEILRSMKEKLAELHLLKPDLVVFPEEILISGGDKNNPNWEKNNAAALELVRDAAVSLHTNACVCLEEPSQAYPGKRYNTSYVIDRTGAILGKYRKRHITFRAIAGYGLPGERVVTVDTDIGRLGLSICFDLGWREDFNALADMGAQLVIWQAAYHGGNLPSGYAAVHMFPIVTSVWNQNSRVIDAFGNTIAESSSWDPLVSAEIDLHAQIFHFDHHERMLPALRAAYGDRISVRVEPLGNMFEISIMDPTLTMDEIKTAFDLETYRDYHAGATRDNLEILKNYPEVEN